MAVNLRPYLSPTLVLLALDWEQGETRPDFLGFAILRKPGFRSEAGGPRAAESWLPNRLTFKGAVPADQPEAPSNTSPIQKFLWWDARFDEADRHARFSYTVYPVTGTADAPTLLPSEAVTRRVHLPRHMVDGVGTWFNRGVLSSRAFTRKLEAMGLAASEPPPPEQALALRRWLANDLEQTFGKLLHGASRAAGAIYQLTDGLWAIPALEAFARNRGPHQLALVYDAQTTAGTKTKPLPGWPSRAVIDRLQGLVDFWPRSGTKVVHDNFLVSDRQRAAGWPTRVLTGSADFTTDGLTTRANLLHVFDSPALARHYSERAKALAGDPTKVDTAALAPGWSAPITVGSARLRAAFAPGARGRRGQVDAVVEAVEAARHSVLFCIFTPADVALRQACFEAGDKGLMMLGIVNSFGTDASCLENLELYHRNRANRDVIPGAHFSPATVPEGFLPELTIFPGDQRKQFGVVIHHRFVVVDAEGPDPVVYTGSANTSENAQHRNDDDLLEIRDRRVAAIYLAEFMRLYEHYRARAIDIAVQQKAPQQRRLPLALQRSRRWADKYFRAGSPEAKSRIAMARLLRSS